MRLNPTEIAAIERAARETFAPRSTIRLFGSRPDDSRRGGDIDLIDLLVEPPAPLSPQELVERRHRFIA
ncbi:MAG TPA: nucleotidyltransferase domain-containing protein, partial [Thiocapsa sp.]|nr:nucleotidyltransferase domain-containing protein [Thiocapsa sp.]